MSNEDYKIVGYKNSYIDENGLQQISDSISGILNIEEDYGGKRKQKYHSEWSGKLKTSYMGTLIEQRKIQINEEDTQKMIIVKKDSLLN